MCVGIPMAVIACRDGVGECEGRGRREKINFMLLGDQPPGTWVLTFQGAALRAMTADEARETDRALDALDAVAAGEDDFDRFFADITERAPQLPAHLRGPKP